MKNFSTSNGMSYQRGRTAASLLVALLAITAIYAADEKGTSMLIDQRFVLAIISDDSSHLKLNQLMVDLEGRWSMKDSSYFESMSAVCLALASQSQARPDLITDLIGSASLLLTKDEEVPDKIRTNMFVHQAQVTRSLLFSVAESDAQGAGWNAMRFHALRLTMLFCARLKKHRIIDFIPPQVVMNVMPPNGDGDAGTSPDAITDPVSRTAYLSAIAKNTKNTKLIEGQACLTTILENDFPRLEEAMVRLYSKIHPTNEDYQELREYLQLGSFNLADRQRIIEAVAKESGTNASF